MICYCCSFWSSAQVSESHNAAELGCNGNTAAHEQRPWGKEPCLSWVPWEQVREDPGFWLELLDPSQVVVKHQIYRVAAYSTESWVLCRHSCGCEKKGGFHRPTLSHQALHGWYCGLEKLQGFLWYSGECLEGIGGWALGHLSNLPYTVMHMRLHVTSAFLFLVLIPSFRQQSLAIPCHF